ncbi:MAG: hypothetical protein P4M15_09550 [Alphaproteobacteria bacterium]|nr:hypothetical protein [Alphaproteobacteria bacterium]
MVKTAPLVAVLLCLAGASARAQSGEAPNTDIAPPSKQENLSDKLDKSNGVIKPQDDVDPAMTKPAPQTNQPTRIVPAPGSPGGDPKVQPK